MWSWLFVKDHTVSSRIWIQAYCVRTVWKRAAPVEAPLPNPQNPSKNSVFQSQSSLGPDYFFFLPAPRDLVLDSPSGINIPKVTFLAPPHACTPTACPPELSPRLSKIISSSQLLLCLAQHTEVFSSNKEHHRSPSGWFACLNQWSE